MKLYFVRHGETDWNIVSRMQGYSDVPLNQHGIKQAESLREKIREQELSFDVCYSSPLKRALKTAEIITDGRMKIVQDVLLKERCFGEYEGQILYSWDDLEEDVFDETINSNIHQIEPILEFQQRAGEFLKKVKAANDAQAKILIVASNGIIKRMLFLATNNEYYKSGSFHLDNCEMVEIEI